MVGQHHQLSGHEFEQALEMVREGEALRVQFMESQRVGHN